MGALPSKKELYEAGKKAEEKFTLAVDNLDSLNIADFYASKPFIELINKFPKKRLGEGAFGQVFNLRNTNLVVKVIKPCGSAVLKEYCWMAGEKEQQIYKVPNDDKSALLLPNYLSDSVIGGLMGRLVEGGYCPFYSLTYTSYFDRRAKVIYIVGEMLEHLNIRDGKDLIYFFFLIAFALKIGQEQYGFVHYDLYTENVLSQSIQEEIISLPGNMHIKSRGWIPKIIDYGLARAETPIIRVLSRVNVYSPGFYVPIYDILMLWGCVFSPDSNCLRRVKGWQKYIARLDPTFEERFISVILKKRYSKGNTDYHNIFSEWFEEKTQAHILRPNASRIALEKVGNMNEVIKFLYNEMKKYDMIASRISHLPHASIMKVKRVEPLFKVSLKLQKAVFENIKIPKMLGEERAERIIHPVMDGVVVESTITNPDYYIQKYNLTYPEGAQNSDCKLTPQYTHVVYVNTKKLPKGAIISDCCKINPASYLENRTGLVINGGFFSVLKSWEPIGPYKDKHLSTDLKISDEYKEFYKLVFVENNTLKITDLSSLPSIKKRVNYWFTAAPMLVQDGKEVFTVEKVETKVKNTRIFQCREPTDSEKRGGYRFSKDSLPPISVIKEEVDNGKCQKVDLRLTTYNPNCSKIDPGELSHASNALPRTALILRSEEAQKDGKGELCFVMVEGRLLRGAGADLVYMAKLCKKLGARAAVSLDGGRSSQIVWRTKYNPNIIYRANPTSAKGYAVGNIIGILSSK